jgi:lipopolysaccharide assembly outer membrane protein LptD (OstA)
MKSVLRIVLFSVIIIGLTSSLPVWASGSEKVKITGITKVWGDTDKKISYLEGDLLIVQGDVKIRTKYAEIDQDKKEAKFSQGVHLEKKDLIIDGLAFNMNFKKKQGTFLGAVKLERKESKDSNGKTKDRFKLDCDRLDVDTDKENFTAYDNAVIEHKDFNGKSNTVEYRNDSQLLTMTGQAELFRKGKENLNGEQVEINLDKKSFEVFGSAELTFDVDKEDDESKNAQGEKDEKKKKDGEEEQQKDVKIEMDTKKAKND